MKKLFALVIMMLVLVLSGCSKKAINTWEEIEERGYIIIGLDDTFAPMGFRNNAGELIGFDIDLAKEVGKRLGVTVKFQTIDWDSKVLELNSGTIDMIWNGLTITEERELEMLFSAPYIENTQMIIASSEANINQISDLTGKKVGVQISSSAYDAVSKNAISTSLGELIKYDQYSQALIELKNKTIDAVVIDEIMGRYMINNSDYNFIVAEERFTEETYGIGYRMKSISIRDKIDEVLNAIKDGTTSEISMKWFDEDIFI